MKPIHYMQHIVYPAAEAYWEIFDEYRLADPDIGALFHQIVAVAYQESKLIARKQYGGGPARGFLQFEKMGVINDVAVRGRGLEFVEILSLPCPRPRNSTVATQAMYDAVTYNDMLGVWLFIDKYRLHRLRPPRSDAIEVKWEMYLATWAPGKPRRDEWDEACEKATEAVEAMRW